MYRDDLLFTAMASLAIRIADNVNVSGHTEYVIETTFMGRSWMLQQRFSKFDMLHRSLRSALRNTILPDLPPKQFFGR